MDHCLGSSVGSGPAGSPRLCSCGRGSRRRHGEAPAAWRAHRGPWRLASFQPDEEFVIHRTQTCISAGKCYRFMRRVIKNVSKRLVKLMVQVNCMK